MKEILIVYVVFVVFVFLFLTYPDITGFITESEERTLLIGGLMLGFVVFFYLVKSLVSHLMWKWG